MRKNQNRRFGIRFAKVCGAILLIAGFALLAYVPLAMIYNGAHTTKVVSAYSGVVDKLPEQDKKDILASANAYNERLREASPLPFSSQLDGYDDELSISGTQIMGRVVSEEVGLDLPIYHGTDDSVLMLGAGHLSGSSLPVGGVGTHCVLMGHTGMPEARLFDGIQDLKEGDMFTIDVLDERHTYRIDSIKTVLPEALDGLRINQEEDRCTLVTCTPYGINSHRLLVSGTRVHDITGAKESNGLSRYSSVFLCGSAVLLVGLGLLLTALALRRKKRKLAQRVRRNRGNRSTVSELALERSISYAKNGW